MLKPDGQMEHPWETAQRMAAHDIRYWNDQHKEWQYFDLNEYVKENEREEYLECLVTGVQNTADLRYIGLFVVNLQPSIRIGVLGSDQAEVRLTLLTKIKIFHVSIGSWQLVFD